MTEAPSLPVGQVPRFLTLRLSIMMFLQWAMFGLWVPVLGKLLLTPVRADGMGGMGFTNWEVGWIMGISGSVGALMAPFIGGQIADRHVPTQRLLAVLLIVGGVLKWVTAYQTGFWPWLSLSVGAALALGPTGALTNSLAFAHLSDPTRQFPKIRVWGTIGWIVSGWVFAMVWLQHDLVFQYLPPFLKGQEHPDVTPRLSDSLKVAGLVSIAFALYCLTLPNTPPKRDARAKLAFGKAFALLTRPSFAVLLGTGLLIASLNQIYWIQTPPLLRHLGLRDADLLPAMSIGQFAEIFVMAMLGLMLKRLGSRRVLTIGGAAFALRFAIFGTVGLPLWVILSAQTLHGLCYACFFAGSFIYIDKLADEDVRHSAQTVFCILLGVGPVIGGWLNGQLGARYLPKGAAPDYQSFWYILAAVGLVATVIVAALFRDETKAKQPAPAEAPAEPEQ
jgi:nucleoside transporter